MRNALTPAALSALLLLLAAAPAPAATPPREASITSAYTPSADQDRAARQTVAAFLAATDEGRFYDAHDHLDAELAADQPLERFWFLTERFNTLAGPVRERRITRLTWTTAPAPRPGVHVAVDLVSRFAQVDRHCGTITLFQPPQGGPFRVTRTQTVFMDNATARRLAERSAAALEAAWATASSNCPNYPPN